MSTVSIEEYDKKTKEIHEYLNIWIGFYYNQTYYCGWFWTNVATPISLTLTILTAINAAQSSTKTFIPEDVYTILSFTTMILTTLNSYFRPSVRSIDANTRLVKWIGFGHQLEQLTFDVLVPGKEKFEKYQTLLKEMDGFVCVQAAQERNFITDWWHSLMRWKNGDESELWLSWGQKIDKTEDRGTNTSIEMYPLSNNPLTNQVVTNTSHEAAGQTPSS
jgi:hypothetical protein